MRNIKMVVFDMAGTVVDENNLVYKTVQKVINQAGYNVTLEQVLIQGAGKEKLQAIRSVLATYAGVDDETIAKDIYNNFAEQLKEAYSTNTIYSQPNALEVFAELHNRGIKVVLNTGYNKETAQSIIDKLGWKEGNDFDLMVTATDVDKNRPNPAMILFAMEKFGITNGAEVAKVGDSVIDIEEGINAGCLLTVGITTGAHTAKQLRSAGPSTVVDNLLEILPLIDGESSYN